MADTPSPAHGRKSKWDNVLRSAANYTRALDERDRRDRNRNLLLLLLLAFLLLMSAVAYLR